MANLFDKTREYLKIADARKKAKQEAEAAAAKAERIENSKAHSIFAMVDKLIDELFAYKVFNKELHDYYKRIFNVAYYNDFFKRNDTEYIDELIEELEEKHGIILKRTSLCSSDQNEFDIRICKLALKYCSEKCITLQRAGAVYDVIVITDYAECLKKILPAAKEELATANKTFEAEKAALAEDLEFYARMEKAKTANWQYTNLSSKNDYDNLVYGGCIRNISEKLAEYTAVKEE